MLLKSLQARLTPAGTKYSTQCQLSHYWISFDSRKSHLIQSYLTFNEVTVESILLLEEIFTILSHSAKIASEIPFPSFPASENKRQL
jgi:hypothetical protein